jgi:ribosomal protein S26
MFNSVVGASRFPALYEYIDDIVSIPRPRPPQLMVGLNHSVDHPSDTTTLQINGFDVTGSRHVFDMVNFFRNTLPISSFDTMPFDFLSYLSAFLPPFASVVEHFPLWDFMYSACYTAQSDSPTLIWRPSPLNEGVLTAPTYYCVPNPISVYLFNNHYDPEFPFLTQTLISDPTLTFTSENEVYRFYAGNHYVYLYQDSDYPSHFYYCFNSDFYQLHFTLLPNYHSITRVGLNFDLPSFIHLDDDRESVIDSLPNIWSPTVNYFFSDLAVYEDDGLYPDVDSNGSDDDDSLILASIIHQQIHPTPSEDWTFGPISTCRAEFCDCPLRTDSLMEFRSHGFTGNDSLGVCVNCSKSIPYDQWTKLWLMRGTTFTPACKPQVIIKTIDTFLELFIDPDHDTQHLLLSGDVESNPGPFFFTKTFPYTDLCKSSFIRTLFHQSSHIRLTGKKFDTTAHDRKRANARFNGPRTLDIPFTQQQKRLSRDRTQKKTASSDFKSSLNNPIRLTGLFPDVNLSPETLNVFSKLLESPLFKNGIPQQMAHEVGPDTQSFVSHYIDSFFTQFKGIAKEIIIFLIFCGIIYACYKYGWKKWMAAICFSYLIYLISPTLSSKGVVNYFLELLYGTDESDANVLISYLSRTKLTAGGGSDDIISRIAQATIGALGLAFLRKLPEQKEIDNTLLRLDRLPKAINGASSLFQIIKTAWENSVDWIRENILQQSPILRFDGGQREVEDWIKRMEYFNNPLIWQQILVDPKLVDEIMAIYIKGQELISRYHDFPRITIEKIKSALPTIKTLHTQALNSSAHNMNMRAKPICVLFAGPTSIGKTGCTIPLAGELLKELGVLKPEDFLKEGWSDAHIYSRAVHQEFWDGYVNQEIVIYDDFGQALDSPTNPNIEWFEVIKGVNLFPWNLHMAAISQKNNTLFNAKAVLLTTNDLRMSVKSLISPEAVISRISHPYRVIIKPQYLDHTGRLDLAKVHAEMKVPGPNLNIYLFQRMTLQCNTEGVPCGPPLTYFQMSAQVREALRTTLSAQSDMSKGVSAYLSQDTSAYQSTFILNPTDINDIHDVPKCTVCQSYAIAHSVDNLSYCNPCWRGVFTDDGSISYSRRIELINEHTRIINNLQTKIIQTTLASEQLDDQIADLSPKLTGPDLSKMNLTWKDGKIIEAPQPQSWRDRFTRAWHNFRNSTPVVSFELRAAYYTQLLTDAEFSIQQKEKSLFALCCSNLRSFFSSFIEGARSLLAKAAAWISEHPVLSAITCFSALILLGAFLLPKAAKNYIKKSAKFLFRMSRPLIDALYLSIGVYEFTQFVLLHRSSNKCLLEYTYMTDDGLYRPTALTGGSSSGNESKIARSQKPMLRGTNNSSTAASKDSEFIFIFDNTQALAFFNSLSKEIRDGVELTLRDDRDLNALNSHVLHVIDCANDELHLMDVVSGVEYYYAEPNNEGVFGANSRFAARSKVGDVALTADSQANDLSLKLQQQYYMISFLSKNDTWETLGSTLILRGTTALMPFHFTQLLKHYKAETVVLTNSFNPTGIEVKTSQILDGVRVCDKDMGRPLDAWVCNLGTIFPQRKDITSNLIDRHEQSRINSCNSQAFYRIRKGGEITRDIREIVARVTTIPNFCQDFHILGPKLKAQAEKEGIESIKFAAVHSTQHPSLEGDCGSPLIIQNPAIKGKICGILTLGSHSQSFFQPLCKDDIQTAMDQLPWRSRISLGTLPPHEPALTAKLPEGNFQPIGTARAPPRAFKTQITKSLIHGKVTPPETFPVQLKPSDTFDPLFDGLKKCGEFTPWIDETLLAMATADVQRLLFTQHNEDHPRYKHQSVLTYEEAVEGRPYDPYICSTKRLTSAGYPHIFDKPNSLPGKSFWLGSNDNWNYNTPQGKQLRTTVEKVITDAKQGIRHMGVFTDTCKDERRPPGKPARVFSAGPMDYTLASRMYFLDFASFIQHNRIDNQIAIGINPTGLEWKKLAALLQSKGRRVVAGDFTNYDGSLSPQILFSICDLINNFYDDSDENRKIRMTLMSSITSGVHIADNTLYQWNKSLPSGNPFTALFNSIYNLISMRVVWLLTTGLSLQAFNDNVWMIAYGDDNVIALSKLAEEIFNQQIMSDGYKKLGMTYTDEAKTGVSAECRRLDEVTFLKRGFRYDEDFGQVVGNIKQRTIFEMLNWIRKGALPPIEATALNVKDAFIELSLWGREFFNEWAPKIIAVLPPEVDKAVGTTITTNFDSYVLMYRSGEMGKNGDW